MSQERDTRTLAIVVAVAIAVVTWFAYGQVTQFEFIGIDDDAYVVKNRVVLGGLTAEGVGWAWTTGEAANWHPLTWMSHMLDVELFGLDAGAHHRTALMLHVLCALLLFGAIRCAFRSLGVAALTASLFALHPLHVESVAWVSERKDVLSTAFGFAALWAYAIYARRGGAWRFALVAAGLGASLCSKATFVTLPFVLLMLDVWPLGRLKGGPRPAFSDDGDDEDAPSTVELRRLVLEKVPLLGMAILSSAVTFLVQDAGGATLGGKSIALPARVANALVAYVAYLDKTLVPRNLAALYPHPNIVGDRAGWSVMAVAGSALLLVAITALAWWLRRRRPYVLLGWLWYLGTLVPVIGLVQVGWQAMADRYTYIPLVGVFFALGCAMVELGRARPPLRSALIAAGVVVSLGCAWLTRMQAETWRNNDLLARRALEISEYNGWGHAVVADSLRESGRAEEALPRYLQAIECGHDQAAAFNNLGLCLFDLGRPEEAMVEYQRALQVDIGFAPAHNNLGRALSQAERFEEAEKHYNEALRLDPGYLDAHNNLGADLARRGRFEEALPHLQTVLRLDPTPSQAFNGHVNLGLIYTNRAQAELQRGNSAASDEDRRRAAENFRAAQALDPSNGLPAQLLGQLGYGS